MENYKLTEMERRAFWAYHNGGRRVKSVVAYLQCPIQDALDVLENIESKLMRQARHCLQASLSQREIV